MNGRLQSRQRRRNGLTIAIGALVLPACERRVYEAPIAIESPKSAALPEITSASEPNGFHDLVFALTGKETRPDGGKRLTASTTHKSLEMRVQFDLGATWKASTIAGSIPSYSGTVHVRPVGMDSDPFIIALDLIYGTRQYPNTMAAVTEFTAISLEGDPTDLSKSPVKLKLFLESEDEERYAEAYLNIDEKASRLYLNEKDPEYRKALVMALQQKAR